MDRSDSKEAWDKILPYNLQTDLFNQVFQVLFPLGGLINVTFLYLIIYNSGGVSI